MGNLYYVGAAGRAYNVVIAASLTAPGYQLVGNAAYPEITDDYKAR